MIYLAYDGTINGDWIFRYALQFAKTAKERLCVLHVPVEEPLSASINEKIEKIRKLAQQNSVSPDIRILPLEKSVDSTIISAVDGGLCICGTRARGKKKGYIAGTISEKLLRQNKFSVLALRVVHPGLLGSPDDIMLAASGRTDVMERNLSVISLLSKHAKSLHILRIMEVNRMCLRHLSPSKARSFRQKGLSYLKELYESFREKLPSKLHLDIVTELSSDWTTEILIQAGKLKTDFILLGATEKVLPSRFFYGDKLEKILRDSPCDVGVYKYAG